MTNFFIVNGYARNGKTSFAEFYKDCKVASSVDIVKQVAKLLGWNGDKDPSSRKFLSDIKDLATSYCDHSIKYATKLSLEEETVFYDSREPDEIQRLEDEIDNAISIFISNPNVENSEIGNHADDNVENHQYDIYLTNDGTVEDWQRKAEAFRRLYITVNNDVEFLNMDTNQYEKCDFIHIGDKASLLPYRSFKMSARKEVMSDIVNGLVDKILRESE